MSAYFMYGVKVTRLPFFHSLPLIVYICVNMCEVLVFSEFMKDVFQRRERECADLISACEGEVEAFTVLFT